MKGLDGSLSTGLADAAGRVGDISSTAEEKRTPGPSSLALFSVPIEPSVFRGASVASDGKWSVFAHSVEGHDVEAPEARWGSSRCRDDRKLETHQKRPQKEGSCL